MYHEQDVKPITIVITNPLTPVLVPLVLRVFYWLRFMNSLIEVKAIEVGHDNMNAVSARDLWKSLGVKTRFNDWVRRRLEESDALQDVDFSATQKRVVGESNTYGQGRIDYL